MTRAVRSGVFYLGTAQQKSGRSTLGSEGRVAEAEAPLHRASTIDSRTHTTYPPTTLPLHLLTTAPSTCIILTSVLYRACIVTGPCLISRYRPHDCLCPRTMSIATPTQTSSSSITVSYRAHRQSCPALKATFAHQPSLGESESLSALPSLALSCSCARVGASRRRRYMCVGRLAWRRRRRTRSFSGPDSLCYGYRTLPRPRFMARALEHVTSIRPSPTLQPHSHAAAENRHV